MRLIEKIIEKFNKPKSGDKIVEKIIEIVEKEKINISYNNNDGGYTVDINECIYSFSKYGRNFCMISIYNITQRISDGNYKGLITGQSFSSYSFSDKYWEKIINIHSNQRKEIDINILNSIIKS